jgi:hypothetical protein
MAFVIAAIACALFFQYWDVQRMMQRIIYRAWEWFGEILGMSSSFTNPWKQPGASQITGQGDGRWDFLWSDEPSSTVTLTLGSYATEKPVVGQSN